jgi:hypothetical protein
VRVKTDKKTRRRIRRALQDREAKAAAAVKKRGLRALAVSGMLGLLGVKITRGASAGRKRSPLGRG